MATLVPGPGWAIAAGIVGGVVVGKIIDSVFDRSDVKNFFKDTDKKIGKAVSGFFGSVGKALSW